MTDMPGTRVEEAHNPEVAGSNPAPATKVKPQVRALFRLRDGALFCVRCGCIAPIPCQLASKNADARWRRVAALGVGSEIVGGQ